MTIFPEFNFEQGTFVLMVKSKGMSPTVAGPRIFRQPPHPVVEWEHATQESANAACRVVMKYLEELPARKVGKKENQAQAD